MSNFLQRIVASAAQGQSQPRPRLQPMLGSIFAPTASLASTFEAPPIEGGAAGAPEVYSESETSRPALRDERLFPSVPGNKFSLASSVPPQKFEPHDDGRLLPLEYSGEAFPLPGKHSPRRGEGITARGNLEGTVKADQAPLSRVGKEDSDERSGAKQIRSLIAPSAIQVQSLRAAAQSPVAPVSRVSTQRSEPDEIHIHIGRIEVAAVASPPPRAAAPAPRKGINLDEYLRRGSGGQR
ncbi:MAG: hypothetical protein WBQ95_17535 [Terracidiphilus sp.]